MNVDGSDRTVRNLFIGGGHSLNLDNSLDSTGSSENGKLEFEGNVNIYGDTDEKLTADWMIVFSRTEATVVATTDAEGRIEAGDP